jgi:hypothetical protein
MARIHYVILDESLIDLFDLVGVTYETVGGKFCVPYENWAAVSNEIDEYLWENPDEDELWDLWGGYEYVESYWSTESQTWA